MDGFINILKPPGMTSHDVIGWLRRLFQLKRIGHGGTLDPDVAGVLPVALGKATRLLEYIIDSDKVYRCELLLGITTTTQDLSGVVIAKKTVHPEQLAQAPAALQQFLGKITQIPPMVSAVRHQGQRLYQLARQGIAVERQPRQVTIHHIELLETNFACSPYTMSFDVRCSKGTYIRTLCHDLGERLGCGASLSFLLRQETGGFLLRDSWTLEEIADNWQQGKTDFLLSLPEYIPLPHLLLDAEQLMPIIYGRQLLVPKGTPEDLQTVGQKVQILDGEGLVAIAEVKQENGQLYLQPRKVFR